MNMPVAPEVELTIVMPCLDEAETLAICIEKAQGFFNRSGIAGEIVIADNGSTDGSQDIARARGARVVDVDVKGYGAALAGGIAAARGTYVIMGDADDSYDFANLDGFVDRLRDGADLVMGNRFAGGIEDGAMPWLHKYIGNPVLSFAGRLFFTSKIADFHCGLRGFRRDSIRALNLRTTGMEFASEMVVKATLSGLRIDEVPTTLKKDGRTRPPHLRSFRDGWRHLRFLLLFSPRWLFLYPGMTLLFIGFALTALLAGGPVAIGPSVTLDLNTMLVGAMCVIVGMQAISFALIGRRFATHYGFIPPSNSYGKVLDALTLERLLVVSLVLVLAGLLGLVGTLIIWANARFGPLDYEHSMRGVIQSTTALVAGLQLMMTGFLSSMISIPIYERRLAPMDATMRPKKIAEKP